MKDRVLKAVLVAFAFSALQMPAAWALPLLDTIQFPAPTLVKDTQSGNGIDYTYFHTVVAAPQGAELLSGKLMLTHAGNPDDGPRQEVWFAFSGGGIMIGKLSASEPGPLTDEWQLPGSVLSEFLAGGWQLSVGLSEQTVFNSEQIQIFRSVLEIEYVEPGPAPSVVPEPGSLFLVGAGLFFAGAGRKYLRSRGRKNSV